MAVLPDGPGRPRSCTAPGKSRALCQFELRSLQMPGRNRTCGPRVQAGALPAELRPHDGRRIRDKGSNPDLHVQSVASCRLDDPGTALPLRPSPGEGDRRSRHSDLVYVSRGWRRAMFSMPLAYPSTLDRRPPAAHTRADVVLRGGALEPGASTLLGKSQAKAHAYSSALFPGAMLRAFLSQAGPRFELDLLQAEHHLDLDMTVRLQKRRRRPGWVALERIAMRLGT